MATQVKFRTDIAAIHAFPKPSRPDRINETGCKGSSASHYSTVMVMIALLGATTIVSTAALLLTATTELVATTV